MAEQAQSSAGVVLRTARAEDLPALLDVTVAAFGERARGRMSAQLYEDSGHRLHQSRLAAVDGVIASYVRVSARPIHYGAAVLPVGAIGAVSARPEYRGRGLPSALLRDAIPYMRAEGYVLSMLFTGIQGFYARLGWAPFPESSCRVPVPERAAAGGTAARSAEYVVRPFVEETDLDGVTEVYARYNARRTGAVARDAAYWRDGHTRFLGILPRLVAEHAGRVAAYASWQQREERLDVYEAGCLPHHEGAFMALATTLLATARDNGVRELGLTLGQSHGLVAALRTAAGTPAETVVREHMMLLVLDLVGLLRAALPAFQERLAAQPWLHNLRASFALQVAGQSARLAVAEGQVSVEHGAVERTLPLDQRLFWRLFLGASSLAGLAEELATVAGIHLSASEEALLAALWPPQDPHYWRPDHF